MRIEFPVYHLMICRGLALLRSEKYKHFYCYAVFSSFGEVSYLLSDCKLSALDLYKDYPEFFLVCEMYSERGEK